MSSDSTSGSSHLSQLAKSGSKGGFDSELLRRAQETLDNAKTDFGKHAETEVITMINHLNTLMDQAKSPNPEPSIQEEALNGIMHSAHELRGQGGTFGYSLLTSVCASMYYFAKSIDLSSLLQLKVLQLYADSVRLIIVEQISGDGGKSGAELLDGLTAAVEKVKD